MATPFLSWFLEPKYVRFDLNVVDKTDLQLETIDRFVMQ